MIYEKAVAYPNGLHSMRLYSKGSDRSAWESIPSDYRKQLVEAGEALVPYHYPALPATTYMEFVRNGNRSRFRALYHARRCPLNTLVMAECVQWEGKFLDDIINGIYAICEESGWQYPAHNNHLNQPCLCLPDSDNPVLDLFAAETGAQLAMIDYLLGEQLDAVSPLIRKRIRSEIKRRILTPYLKNRFWWMGGWGGVNNWTPWITQNVLIALFHGLDFSDEEKYQVFYQAARSLDYFLDEYGEDGCCNEGPHYYRAAGLCLFNAIELLNAITDQHFLGIYEEPKIRNLAAYILHVYVGDRYYVNFGDGEARMGCAGAREFLFAKRVKNEAMVNYAAADHRHGTQLSGSENLFYRIQEAFTERELRQVGSSLMQLKGVQSEGGSFTQSEGAQSEKGSLALSVGDHWYESVGLLLAQDETFFLAVKAGGNGDSHNHNDTGSLILYKDRKPFLIDIGVETYSKKTFSAERYEIWTMQSAWHNLVTFGEVMQCPGGEYRSQVLEVGLEETGAHIAMELKGAYPQGTIVSYQRSVEFIKGQGIRVIDTFDSLPKGTYLSFLTVEKPQWQGQTGGHIDDCRNGRTDDCRNSRTDDYRNGQTNEHANGHTDSHKCARLAIGELGTVEIECAGEMDIEEVALTDPKLKDEWGEAIYRSRFYPQSSRVEWRIIK